MGRLIYAALASLDGYTADENGEFGWAEPDEEVHRFVNELERELGTYLYGRRMYETMHVWDQDSPLTTGSGHTAEYARIWRAAEKIVYSRTLDEPVTARTRIEREFEPEAVRALKEATDADLGIGGPELAAQALHAGLVDEVALFVAPAIVGGGTRSLPDGLRLDLDLVAEHRFDSGFAFLRYRVQT